MQNETAIHQVLERQIRARAYGIYQTRGSLPGHEIDDWLQAEYELRQLPIEKLAELNPPAAKNQRRHSALISLVQAALILAGGTTQL